MLINGIDLGKSEYQENINFLFYHKSMIYVVGTDIVLEAPCQGTSNEYPQHMFSWRRKKNINTFH